MVFLVQRNYPSLAALSSTAEPPEDSIAMLVSMGFDRNSAREALMHARNDINVATNILLEAQSHWLKHQKSAMKGEAGCDGYLENGGEKREPVLKLFSSIFKNCRGKYH